MILIGPTFMKMHNELNAVVGFSEPMVIFLGKDTFSLLKKEVIYMSHEIGQARKGREFDCIVLNFNGDEVTFKELDKE